MQPKRAQLMQAIHACHVWIHQPIKPPIHAGPRQRAYFEELTREGQQLVAKPPPSARAPRRRSQKRGSREEVLDALIFPRGNREGHGPPLPAQGSDAGEESSAVGSVDGSSSGSAGSSEPMFDIHEVSKVPPLFGSRQQRW
jgi:hypothetical protein